MSYYNKYLKYKNKYLELSKQSVINMQGGASSTSWVCPTCTYDSNYGNNCNICGAQKEMPRAGGGGESSSASSTRWSCPTCTYDSNYGDICNICTLSKPRPGPEPGPRPGPVVIGDKFKKYHDLMGGSDKPTLQNILTSANEYARFQFKGNPVKRESFLKALTSILGDIPCLITTVRGNGLCALNATSMSLFTMIPEKNSYDKLLEQTKPYHNLEDDSRGFMPHDFKFNIELYDYCISILKRVDNVFSEVTTAMVATKAREMSRTPDYVRTIMKDNFDWESELINKGTWSLQQMGQIISSNIGCIIITIEIDVNKIPMDVTYSGIFPGGEYIIKSDKKTSELKESIRNKIVTGEWKVVFNINLGIHYNSLLPHSSDNITQSHIELFLKIIDNINWV